MERTPSARQRWHLFVFDIDGTLIDLAGAGRRAMERAFGEVLGRRDALASTSFAGRTDLGIARGVIGVQQEVDEAEVDETAARVFAAYERLLPDEIARTPYAPTPGATELLDRLSREPMGHLGLATGNLESASRIKLRSAGIEHTFSFGAFGSEHAERSELVRAAIRSGARLLPEGAPFTAWVLGDTPADVAAARANGARSIAVAQGPFSVADLLETDAHLVVPDLETALERRFWLEEHPSA